MKKFLRHDFVLFTFIFVATFVLNYSISKNYRFFHADDWAWLERARASAGLEGFNLLPTWIYNDRPVGALFINIEYFLFKLDYLKFQIVHLFLHSLNTLLIASLLKKHLSNLASLFGAMFFGLYLPANGAIFWPAAIFDLLGLTLMLFGITLLVSNWGRNHAREAAWSAALLFFLAIRTKELFIVSPMLFFGFYLVKQEKPIRLFLRRYYPIFIPSIFLGIIYVHLFFIARESALENDPYGLTFSGVIGNVSYYLEYFNIFASIESNKLLIIGLFILCVSLFFFQVKKELLYLGVTYIAGFFLLLSPVLILGGQRSPLYLYAPHMLLGMALATIFDMYKKELQLILIFSWLFFYPFIISTQENQLAFTKSKSVSILNTWENSKEWMRQVNPGDTVYLSGLEAYFNPFSYGPGNSIRIFTNNANLQVYMELPEDQLKDLFCRDRGDKLYIYFNGSVPINVTRFKLKDC